MKTKQTTEGRTMIKWESEKHETAKGVFFISDQDSALVAKVYSAKNVSLIVAAPDLLEACKAAAQTAQWEIDHAKENGRRLAWRHTHGHLVSAIAKAEGR